MKRLLILLGLLAGCAPDPVENGWTLVGYGPENSAIYKKHDDREKVTFYGTVTHGRHWVVSVVKD